MFLKISAGLFVSLLSVLSYDSVGAMEEDQQNAQKSLSKSYGASGTEKRDSEDIKKLEADLKSLEDSIDYVQCSLEKRSFSGNARCRYRLGGLDITLQLKRQLSEMKTLRLDLEFIPFFVQMDSWIMYPGEHHLPQWDTLLSHLGRTYMEEYLSKFSLTEIINIGFNIRKSHPRSMCAIEWNKDSFPLKGENSYQEQQKKLKDELQTLLSQEEKKADIRIETDLAALKEERAALLLLLNSAREK